MKTVNKPYKYPPRYLYRCKCGFWIVKDPTQRMAREVCGNDSAWLYRSPIQTREQKPRCNYLELVQIFYGLDALNEARNLATVLNKLERPRENME